MDDPEDMVYMLLSQITTFDGKKKSADEVLDLPLPMLNRLAEEVQPVVTDKEDVDGQYTGKLPSGKFVTWRVPTGRDAKNAKKKHGAEAQTYGIVEEVVEIEGKKVGRHDVEIMDGLDFMALMSVMMEYPI